MRRFKKILTFTIVLAMIAATLTCFSIKGISAVTNIDARGPINVGVLSYDFSNIFSSLVGKSLEDIQKENPDKVRFTFFDGQRNPATEIAHLNNMIDNNYDIIFASLVDRREPEIIEEVVSRARQKNIPIIFFNISPAKLDVIKGYPKSLIINTDSEQAGVLQGNMIVDYWNANKETIDKNGDDIMQYILMKGEAGSFLAETKAKYPILTINNAGVKTQEISSVNADWEQNTAENSVESIFTRYGNKIEVIISSNDSMAIGAIKALQKYGYNMGDKEKTIPVFGINATAEAQDLITKGFMAGSIPQDSRALADALYTVGANLVSGKNPLDGTNYKFDETGIIINIPYQENTTQQGNQQ